MKKQGKPKPPERILSADELQQGLSCLFEVEPRFGDVVRTVGYIPLRYRPPTFETLAGVVVSQHVSEVSAAAVFGRLKDALDVFTVSSFLALPIETLIAAGLTRAKQATLIGLANAIEHDGLDLPTICALPLAEATARLVALKGVGPWTAEVFLMQSGGYPDIFPAGDVALQQAMADVFGYDPRPGTKQAAEIAKAWSPVRGIAARVLWAHYQVSRKRPFEPLV